MNTTPHTPYPVVGFTGYDDADVQTCPNCDEDTLMTHDHGHSHHCIECGYSVRN